MKRDLSNVHPELRPLAKKIPRFTFSRKNLWLWRFVDKVPWKPKRPEDMSIENIYIPRRDESSTIRVRIYRLKKTIHNPAPVLLWLHGGGYFLGKPEQDDALCMQYVRELGIVVVSVDYRCAPEYPFPKGLMDSYDALKWIHSNASQLGMDVNHIAIGGESAGGGLAAALTQYAFDRKEVKLIFQLLVYPMLDDRTCIRQDLVNQNYLVWNQESNRFGWESYLQKECGAVEVPAYSVPARRENHSGLPPAWIGVGSLDLFHDENAAYAQRLRECGVPSELYVVPGDFHGFLRAGPQVKVVEDFRRSQIDALRKYLF